MTKKMLDDLMVQQQIKAPYKKWKHMVGVICLNQTYRKQVKEVLPKLFKQYPNPVAFIRGRQKTQENLLKRHRQVRFRQLPNFFLGPHSTKCARQRIKKIH